MNKTSVGRQDGIRPSFTSPRQPALVLLSLIFLAAVFGWPSPLVKSAGAYEFRPQGWELPNIYGADRYQDVMTDIDKNVPGDETRVERFHTPDGGRVFRFSHRGNVFSYEVDHDRKDPMDFKIVDLDGDGIFAIRTSPYDEYPLPPWTRERSFPGY